MRVKLVRGADGAIEAVKHAQEGAGVITSLTETDGLVELAEDVTDGRAGRDRRVPVLRGARGVTLHPAQSRVRHPSTGRRSRATAKRRAPRPVTDGIQA